MDLSDVIRQLTGLLSDWGAGEPSEVRKQIADALAGVGDSDARRLFDRVSSDGADYGGYNSADPLARRLSRAVVGSLLEPGSQLHDPAGALARARREPVILMGNHLSYVDANVLDALFATAGGGDVGDRLTVLVGPKVYSRPVRVLASLCFGTIKIPQPPSRASEEAVMPRREVARLAVKTLVTFAERRAAGDHLLLFPEGARSRTGQLQRVLAAAARYLEVPDSVVVPFGLWGSDALLPLGDDHFRRARVEARLGPPVDGAALIEAAHGRRPVVSDALGFLIADQLPERYRGYYASATEATAPAREAASRFGAR